MKIKIGDELTIEYVPPASGYPDHIAIENSLNKQDSVIIWKQSDAFLLAYKLMSLASEMK